MLRVKHRHQVINQKGREEEKDYMLIQVIEKIKFVMNIHNKKYYINNIGFTTYYNMLLFL